MFLCKQVEEFQFPVNTIINSHHLLKNVIIWYKENVFFHSWNLEKINEYVLSVTYSLW